jgi:hypothetical protein
LGRSWHADTRSVSPVVNRYLEDERWVVIVLELVGEREDELGEHIERDERIVDRELWELEIIKQLNSVVIQCIIIEQQYNDDTVSLWNECAKESVKVISI